MLGDEKRTKDGPSRASKNGLQNLNRGTRSNDTFHPHNDTSQSHGPKHRNGVTNGVGGVTK